MTTGVEGRVSSYVRPRRLRASAHYVPALDKSRAINQVPRLVLTSGLLTIRHQQTFSNPLTSDCLDEKQLQPLRTSVSKQEAGQDTLGLGHTMEYLALYRH